MTHEFKSMASGDGLSAVDVESSHLGLCCQGHDRFDYLCLLDMKKCQPARLHAFDFEKYNALL
jgi:hypothetical protein